MSQSAAPIRPIPSHAVPMLLKTGDCVIAAVATALSLTYETAASSLGIELGTDGLPVREAWPWPDNQGPIDTLKDISARLTASGFDAGLVTELPPVFIELLVAASRGPAVLFLNSLDPVDDGKGHALAYRDGCVMDCRAPDSDLDLNELSIGAAIVFFKAGGADHPTSMS